MVAKEYNILALDDRPMVLEEIRHLVLQQENVCFTGVTQATQVSLLLEEGRRFDLFFLNLELSGADGSVVLAAIRRHSPQSALVCYNESLLSQMRLLLGRGASAPSASSPVLSERERQVLELIGRGLNTQEISRALFISTNTVATYRRRLMSKFDAHNVAQLIAKARESSFH